MPPKKRPGPKSKTQPGSEPPAKRPGPKSKTQPRENEEAASVSSRVTYDPTQKVYRCRYCGRLFKLSRDLRQHKLDHHMDELTHVTEATVQPPDREPDAASDATVEVAPPRSPDRRLPAHRTRPSASTAHKTSKPVKKKTPKHKTRNRLPLAINRPEVAQNGERVSNPSSSSG